MEHGTPDPDAESGPPGPPGVGMSLPAFEQLNEALEGARRTCFLAEAARTQTLLLLWDGMVLDETERGLVVAPNGKAERAFTGHLAGLLHVSRNRMTTILHSAITARGLTISFGLFVTGAFGWEAMETVVRNAGALRGGAREQYDLRAARLAAEEVPQLLDAALSRLHDELDPDAATENAAHAHRERRVRARPGSLGAATLTLTGPETDIAAIYETVHRLAVAAHGLPGETRSMDQLRYDCMVDAVLHGFATTPADLAREREATPAAPAAPSAAPESGPSGAAAAQADDPRTPSTPFERLGDPRVPQRKAIRAEIVVTVPAATAIGVASGPGRLLGWGSLAPAEARRIVASARHWTRAEIDPVDDAILGFDSQERTIPTALRRLIWMRADTCDEPGCLASAHLADIDHLIRVEHGGRTTEINLSALCRPSHQTKDDGYVDVERGPGGKVTWHTTRWGGRKTKQSRIVLRRRPVEQPEGDPAPWDRAA